MLLPHEIRKKEFSLAMGGYARSEVKSYLEYIADNYEKLRRENDELSRRLDAATEKLDQYQAAELAAISNAHTDDGITDEKSAAIAAILGGAVSSLQLELDMVSSKLREINALISGVELTADENLFETANGSDEIEETEPFEETAEAEDDGIEAVSEAIDELSELDAIEEPIDELVMLDDVPTETDFSEEDTSDEAELSDDESVEVAAEDGSEVTEEIAEEAETAEEAAEASEDGEPAEDVEEQINFDSAAEEDLGEIPEGTVVFADDVDVVLEEAANVIESLIFEMPVNTEIPEIVSETEVTEVSDGTEVTEEANGTEEAGATEETAEPVAIEEAEEKEEVEEIENIEETDEIGQDEMLFDSPEAEEATDDLDIDGFLTDFFDVDSSEIEEFGFITPEVESSPEESFTFDESEAADVSEEIEAIEEIEETEPFEEPAEADTAEITDLTDKEETDTVTEPEKSVEAPKKSAVKRYFIKKKKPVQKTKSDDDLDAVLKALKVQYESTPKDEKAEKDEDSDFEMKSFDEFNYIMGDTQTKIDKVPAGEEIASVLYDE